MKANDMHAVFQTLDGAVQFIEIPNPPPRYWRFALLPQIKFDSHPNDAPLIIKHRDYEFMGRNDAGIPFYREVHEPF